MRLWRIFVFLICLDNYSKSQTFPDSGQLYSWGRADYGQLGRSCDRSCDPIPKPVADVQDVASIVCGSEHNLILTGMFCVLHTGLIHTKSLAVCFWRSLFADLRKLSENSFWAGFENIVKLDKPFLCFADWWIILIYMFDWLLQKYGQIITPK